MIPIFPPADSVVGAPPVLEYDPVPNMIPPMFIESRLPSASVTFVPIMILFGPTPLYLVNKL